MSFSSLARSEIAKKMPKQESAKRIMLGALAGFCGSLTMDQNGISLSFVTNSSPVARLLFSLIKDLSLEKPRILATRPDRMLIGHQYVVSMTASQAAHVFGEAAKAADVRFRTLEETQAYIKGAFLGAGSITSPKKDYHAEFVCSRAQHAKKLMKALSGYGIKAALAERKENALVYVKDAEHIGLLLSVMGAGQALMELENIRIMRQMRGNINRAVNCDTANAKKTAQASAKYGAMIAALEEQGLIASIPADLVDIAAARRDNPDMPLEELGMSFTPPLSKSALNHRLRKFSEMVSQPGKKGE